MSRIVHFEISAKEPEKAAAFYEKVFGWEIKKWEGPTEYWMVMTGDPDTPGIDGGIMRASEGFPSTVNTVTVDDIDAVLAKVEANGGEAVGEKQAIPGVGYQLYVKDVEGTLIGLHQEDTSVEQ